MFFGGLKCTSCGGELELYQGYTGADHKSAAGAGSGYNVEVMLACKACPRVYPIGFARKFSDIIPPVEGESSTDENLSFKQRMAAYAQANHRILEEQGR